MLFQLYSVIINIHIYSKRKVSYNSYFPQLNNGVQGQNWGSYIFSHSNQQGNKEENDVMDDCTAVYSKMDMSQEGQPLSPQEINWRAAMT